MARGRGTAGFHFVTVTCRALPKRRGEQRICGWHDLQKREGFICPVCGQGRPAEQGVVIKLSMRAKVPYTGDASHSVAGTRFKVALTEKGVVT